MVFKEVKSLCQCFFFNSYYVTNNYVLPDEFLHYGSDHAYYLYNVATKKYLGASYSTANVTLNVGDKYNNVS